MSKSPDRDGKHCSGAEADRLRELAEGNTPSRLIALKLKRTPGSIYAKASA